MTDFIVVEGSGSTINVIESSPTQVIVEVITPGPKGDPGAVSSVNGIPPTGNGNVTISKSDIGLSNVSNTSDSDKPVSIAQAAENTATLNSAKSYTDTARSDLSTANTATLNSAKAYAESLVIGLWDDRGNYSAAGGAYPTTGGSGTAGAVLKGDIWTISVGGTLSSVQIDAKQTLRALIDAPGQTAANWAVASANTALDDAIVDNVVGRAPSQNSVFKALALKASLASPPLTGVPTTPTAAVDSNSLQIINSAYLSGQLASVAPLMDGAASVGASARIARQDHAHPSDTSKMDKTGGTFSGGINVPSINGGQLAGNRNRTTNGGCQVAQAGNVTVSAALQYGGCDMFLTGVTAATGISGTIQQAAFGQTTASGYSQAIIGASFTTGRPTFNTRMEGRSVYDLSGKVVTVSGVYYQDTGSPITLSIGLNKPTVLDVFGTVTNLYANSSQVIPSGAYTPFKATFTLAAGDSTNGLEVSIATVSALTVVSKTFRVGDLQLEVGTIATPFEQLHPDTVLHQCQRYLPAFIGALQFAGAVISQNATTISATVPFMSQARVVPTGIIVNDATYYRYNNAAANYRLSAMAYVAASPYSAQLSLTVAGVASGNLPGVFDCDNGNARLLFTGARL